MSCIKKIIHNKNSQRNRDDFINKRGSIYRFSAQKVLFKEIVVHYDTFPHFSVSHILQKVLSENFNKNFPMYQGIQNH